ncbi:adenosylcobalamin-dependent ribonucleoside-diphosphate reductase [Cyclobacterium jeungdonense]|uniref:Vitamin B12-dependent ribonucleotide reductase n=1 Tax=Cyclobacterium jeungdonense TaxID=708087 RepID=A0ABT8CBI8_9BACT|nr:adenosylcobalamin-dependent ribonucleoside-diphosphate reductase [Cyclobacterium jeungdonense]MDN3690154.1 adenosylcobalamin-dependent ribonucleoside-diphosphate reductase [Cyclobacterium jeungdonense]
MVKLADNALMVLKERYLQKGTSGSADETPEELFRRVARGIAAAERKWGGEKEVNNWTESFFEVMKRLAFLPNSPTLMNTGTVAGQLSACFVLPVVDSLESIFSTLKQAALIHQKGGGTGFNFSQLRPKGDPVYTSGGYASGPVSFMKIFDAASAHVKQGGKRSGANMGILNADHPDIEEFISAKKGLGNLQNFNISVGITDAFMKAVYGNAPWDLIHPNNRKVIKTLESGNLWNQIVENALLYGDPGLIFLDTIHSKNPTPGLGKINATNPCGEVPLMPYESCNLGSINLSKMTIGGSVDWFGLEKTIDIAIRFLDDVIEVNQYPNPKIRKITYRNRKIGLGVMGWAEMLIKLGIPYDTQEAVELASRLMHFIQEKSKASSRSLAMIRGPFPNWEKSIYYPNEPLRNATCTSIAPTGTISVIADTSSSIEPLFALAYQRMHVLNDDTLTTVNRQFLDYLYEHHHDVNSILESVFEKGTCDDITSLPTPIRSLFKTALEISPEWHLKHQVAFQRYTDNAVSKTINLPESASHNVVDELYKMAWEHKAKGITVFRNSPKGKKVLNLGVKGGIKGCKVCTHP